jgi:hypothetical protein
MILAMLVMVTALAIWLRQRELVPQPKIGAGEAAVAPARGLNEGSSDESQEPEAARSTPKIEPETAADPQFHEWIKSEAKQLDNANVDSAAKRAEIRKIVAKMTPSQSRQLLRLAKDPRTPAGEKILSTYLLVEGGSKTHGELADLITSPLAEAQEYEPHSVEEMKGIREKSLRIMAIDGLFSQARRAPAARNALAKAAR